MTPVDSPPRALALDALRGLAILLMVFSGLIPYGVLPDWMYHAQVPPPAHVFNPGIPGITWVDLVFPFFLFALGAAIPLALQARLLRGESTAAIVLGILKRGALLLFFAIYVMHLRPATMSADPAAREWLLALAGFLLLWPTLAALPSGWSAPRRRSVRVLGWAGVVLVLSLFRAKDGGGFSVTRSDIIILVLANVAVSGGLIWLATRRRLDLRLGLLALLLALRLTQSLPGWGQWAWNLSPWPWLGTVYFQQYLFIVIPGTLAGDLLLRQRLLNPAAPDRRLWWLAVLGPLLTLVLLVGLKQRWVIEASLLALTLCAGGWRLLRGCKHPAAPLLIGLAGWGTGWLLLGLAFEPFEGGIKKDKATLSYYFVTSGLACWLLASLIILIDLARRRGTALGLLIHAGQNPLIAYVAAASLLAPLLGLSGLGMMVQAWTAMPWAGVARAALYTGLIAAVAAFCSRRGIFLRA